MHKVLGLIPSTKEEKEEKKSYLGLPLLNTVTDTLQVLKKFFFCLKRTRFVFCFVMGREAALVR
jgi:hypothetical protein